MPAKLSDDILRQAVDALKQCGGNETHAGKLLGIEQGTMAKRLERAKIRGLFSQDEEAALRSRASYHSGRRLPQTADECWAVLDDYIGRTHKPKVGRIAPRAGGGVAAREIVIASDFHAPFQSNEAVGELIRREGGKGKTLVVNGDLQDFYSISRFTKYERVSMESELAATDALLGQLAAAFHDVILVAGNHDTARFEKQLRAMVSMEMVHVIEVLTGGNLSTLRVLAKRYPNVSFAEMTVAGRFNVGWFYQLGDLITAHAEKYSRVPGSALRGIEEWFTDQHDILGLKPWKVLIQAHTHQLGWFPFKADRLLIEGGCMCATHGYQLQARIMGRPQRLGYVTLTQTKGVTDINSIRMVWLDAERNEHDRMAG